MVALHTANYQEVGMTEQRNELNEAIYEHMLIIDKLLKESKTPIFERPFKASIIFVETAILDSTFKNQKELLQSEFFLKQIFHPTKEWYFNKYGTLAEIPIVEMYSGIVCPHGQPVLIRFSKTTRRVEDPNETAWLTFPDHFQDSEYLVEIFDNPKIFNSVLGEDKDTLIADSKRIVLMTRTINLHLMFANYCDTNTRNMAGGIWSHFEKAITDILSFDDSQVSIGCWELSFAIEKTLKVYLQQKTGSYPFSHDLMYLGAKAKKCLPSIDMNLIKLFPTGAIEMRYSQIIVKPLQAVDYYNIALKLVFSIVNDLPGKYKLNNASFLIKGF